MRRKDREVTDKNHIEEILKQCKTCHVAMVDNEKPYVVPLSYGYQILEDGTLELVFHSAKDGKKINILKKNPNVCFEISMEGEPIYADVPCKSGYYYSSVIGYGKVEFLDNVQEKCKALSLMYYQQAGKRVEFQEAHIKTICIYKIVSKEFTGKRKPKV